MRAYSQAGNTWRQHDITRVSTKQEMILKNSSYHVEQYRTCDWLPETVNMIENVVQEIYLCCINAKITDNNDNASDRPILNEISINRFNNFHGPVPEANRL